MKLEIITSADGARRYNGVYDSQLGIDCFYMKASDGALRCLPLNSGTISFFYSDATCTQPLIRVASCATPQFAATYNACGMSMSYYLVGALYSGQVYWSSGTTCNTNPSDPRIRFYQVGVATPLSTFADGTLTP
jgi:hypothetical protein